MRALQITEPGTTRLIDIPRPTPGPEEILLKVATVGLCGSDLSTFRGKNPLVDYPRIPGHEIGGSIAERGAQVPEKFAIGRAVTILPYTSCGSCSACRRGRSNACRENQTLGVQRDGGLTEYIVAPWRSIAPDYGLSAELLPMVEPLTIGFHAVDRAAAVDSETVMVLGCGMIGIGALVRSRLRGARVIAVDIDDAKLRTAKRLGAELCINSREQETVEAVNAFTGGEGADVVVEAAGSPVTSALALEAAAFAGRVCLIGYAAAAVPLETKWIVKKELNLLGSRNATYLDFRAVSAYLASADFPIDEIVSRRVALEEAGRAFVDWSAEPAGITKILVDL